MNLRSLHYLVAIAEHGGFTRAAEHLHIEQPPLSQAIRSLELELGLTLFTRSRRGAVPTEAGSLLLEQARSILEMEERFLSLAQGLARGEEGWLRIGLAGSISLHPLVPLAIRTFREKWPRVRITLQESNTPALCESLHERNINIAIVRPPAPDPTIVVRPLMEEPTVIALPKGHRKSRKDGVFLHELADDPFILFERDLGPGFYDTIISTCQQAGFTPTLGQSAPQITATVPMVAAGMGVAIVPYYLDQIHTGGVNFHPILGPAPHSSIAIASRSAELDGPAANFEALLRGLCRAMP